MNTRVRLAVAVAAAQTASISGLAWGQGCTPEFDGRFSSGDVANYIRTLVPFNDGTGQALYAGGVFSSAGQAPALRVARWRGGVWEPVGAGFNNAVHAVTVFDDGSGPALYAAGVFTMSGSTPVAHVARWNGSQWVALGQGLNSAVNALAVFDPDGGGPAPARLYAAGDFTGSGVNPIARFAVWNGSSWDPVGSGCDATVHALWVHGQALYLGGSFTTAGGVAASSIARFDGSTFAALGSGTNDTVLAITSFDPDGPGPAPAELVAAGEFTAAGGISANRIARWNGSAWLDLGAGLSAPVRCLGVFDDGSGTSLYAGGSFTTAGVVPANRIAKWNGAEWSAVGGGADSVVWSMAPYDDGRGPRLYIGGQFVNVGDARAVRAAMWDGSIWAPLDRGTDQPITSMAVANVGGSTALYVGGPFLRADGIAAQRIARFDGSSFAPLGQGLGNGEVNALAGFDDGSGPALFAAGSFTTAGGVTANRIARCNGSDWSPLTVAANNGVNSTVNAMIVWNDGTGPALYATGFFTSAGGTAVNRIARWNGMTWQPLAGGLDGAGYALAVHDDGSGEALYVGGTFSNAGGSPALRIARWNGSAWSAVGGGFNNRVNALAVFDDGSGPRLYAGGQFTTAGAVSANRIARWNGSTWLDVAAGTNNTVTALAVADEDGSGPAAPALYVGGDFTTAGGITVNRIARWNGSTWSALGPAATVGMDAGVNAMAAFSAGGASRLYVGGAFFSAGGRSAARLARWGCGGGCYANCDGSTAQPLLNVNDFICFQARFVAGDSYANCDGSMTPPILNINDFVCFQTRFIQGCN